MSESETDPIQQQTGRSPTSDKVSCFVCKQMVEKRQTQQLNHAKEKLVWVCNNHIK